MPLSAQQLAAQKNLSYVLAEKLAQRILVGKYAPGSILPGEMELGEQFGVSRTAVREAVKTLTAKGMVLPRPRIGTRVMPQGNWNFLDQELLSWWMTEENFHQVIDHFLVMRSSLEPGVFTRRYVGERRTKSAVEYLDGGNDLPEEAF